MNCFFKTVHIRFKFKNLSKGSVEDQLSISLEYRLVNWNNPIFHLVKILTIQKSQKHACKQQIKTKRKKKKEGGMFACLPPADRTYSFI